MWPPLCLTTSCKRTLAFVTTFRHKSSESARHNFTMWALSCATFSGLVWNTFSFKNTHKRKSHGLISGLWGGHNLPPSWRSGNRCDITRKIKRLIQEIKNHICSVWTGSILHEPLCVYRETCCQEMGMKLFSVSLYRSLVTVSSKKNGPMIPWVEIAVHTLTFAP